MRDAITFASGTLPIVLTIPLKATAGDIRTSVFYQFLIGNRLNILRFYPCKKHYAAEHYHSYTHIQLIQLELRAATKYNLDKLSEKNKNDNIIYCAMNIQKIVLVLLSTMILSSFVLLPTASAQSDFTLISSGDYVDSIGHYHIVGEVQNDSENVVSLVQIEATLLNEDDQVIERPSGRVFIDVMQPGEKSAFHMVFFDSEQNSNISSYEIITSGTIIEDDKPRTLEVSIAEGYVDEMGQHHIVGEVKNNGGVAATFVEVSVAMYDADGNVLDAISGSTVPQSILPGEKASFDIASLAPEAGTTSTVSINVQSVEFANVPEFPIAILGVVGIAMGVIILLGRRNWTERLWRFP